MAEIQLKTKLILRRDNSENWNNQNLILEDGEPGYDKTNKSIKIGDGNSSWKNLDLITPIFNYITSEVPTAYRQIIYGNNQIINFYDKETIEELLKNKKDINVQQNAVINSKGNYPILLASTYNNNETVIGTVNKANTLRFNPNSSSLLIKRIDFFKEDVENVTSARTNTLEFNAIASNWNSTNGSGTNKGVIHIKTQNKVKTEINSEQIIKDAHFYFETGNDGDPIFRTITSNGIGKIGTGGSRWAEGYINKVMILELVKFIENNNSSSSVTSSLGLRSEAPTFASSNSGGYNYGNITFTVNNKSSDNTNRRGTLLMEQSQTIDKFVTFRPSSGNRGSLGSSSIPFCDLYLEHMPFVNNNKIIEKSGSITGDGVSLKFADHTLINYGHFTQTVEATISWGNIYYGTIKRNITFSPEFIGTKPSILTSVQDSDIITTTIMDQDALTLSGYTGRWFCCSSIANTKQITISWIAIGSW